MEMGRYEVVAKKTTAPGKGGGLYSLYLEAGIL
jgi:hypothetical protein